MGNPIKYTGTDETSYSELKNKATSALSKVGKTFSWSSSVGSGYIIKAAHFTELMEAFSTAYNGVVISTTGNSGHGSCSTTTSGNGYSSCSTTTSGNSGNCTDKYQCVSYLSVTGNTDKEY